MKQLLFILALLIGTCFATHAKTIKLVPSALDSTRMDTVVISDLQDVDEDQNATMHNISSDFGDWNSGPPTSVAIVALIICCGLPFFNCSYCTLVQVQEQTSQIQTGCRGSGSRTNHSDRTVQWPRRTRKCCNDKGDQEYILRHWSGSIPLGVDRRRRIGSNRIPYFLYGVGTSIDSLYYHSTQKKKMILPSYPK